jgi:branched-chain amino acid transport system substrate-binding protein
MTSLSFVASVGVVVVVLAGCGSSKPSASASSSAAAGAQGSTLKLMALFSANTPSNNEPEVGGGAEAAAMAINAAGGIDGHRLEIVTCNDQFQPNNAEQCAREAVSDHVLAVVGSTTVFGDNVNPILQAADIPNVGDGVVAPTDLTSPISFPLGAGTVLEFRGLGMEMAQAGISKIGVLQLNNPQGTSASLPLVNLLKSRETPLGNDTSYTGVVFLPLTTSDYSVYAAKLHADGAQGVVEGDGFVPDTGVLEASGQAGYGIKFGSIPFIFGNQDIASLGAAGNGLFIDPDLPPPTPAEAKVFTGIQKFRNQMAAANKAGIANTAVADDDNDSLDAWLSVYAVQAAAKLVTGTLNSNALLHALSGAHNLNLQGIVKWSPANPGPRGFPRISNPYVYFGVVKNGTIVLNSAKPVNVGAGLS